MKETVYHHPTLQGHTAATRGVQAAVFRRHAMMSMLEIPLDAKSVVKVVARAVHEGRRSTTGNQADPVRCQRNGGPVRDMVNPRGTHPARSRGALFGGI